MFISASNNDMHPSAEADQSLDVIMVTGDAYIDAPQVGAAVIARVLHHAGYRVGIISQPEVDSFKDIERLGEPKLFWGVTSGCVDSMVANYTASGKRRNKDDMTPGGVNNKRPDRAVIVYTNLIRRRFKNTVPVVLGGIEAALRRISHYDDISSTVRRSILFDARADVLVYGMGEETVVALAKKLEKRASFSRLRGICYISKSLPDSDPEFPGPDVILPEHSLVKKDAGVFTDMFHSFYRNTDPFSAKRLIQKQDTRYLVQNPPPMPITPEALDRIHELPYTRNLHPYDEKKGRVTALSTIRFSITTHRGCYGECRFCAITAHQGRHVVSRSEASILREAATLASLPDFKGIIADVGGPTANMYGIECPEKEERGACPKKSCLFPGICKKLKPDHARQIALLTAIRKLEGVRKVFVGSGIRYDLILNDKKNGKKYLEMLLKHHVSGQMKIAPEHVCEDVLKLMGKPGAEHLKAFIKLFETIKNEKKLNLFLTYYMMAAHPGCTEKDMKRLRRFAEEELKVLPRQTQIFTPTPSTYSTLMYHTGKNPFNGNDLFVEKHPGKKQNQKNLLLEKKRPGKKRASGIKRKAATRR